MVREYFPINAIKGIQFRVEISFVRLMKTVAFKSLTLLLIIISRNEYYLNLIVDFIIKLLPVTKINKNIIVLAAKCPCMFLLIF